MSRARIIFLGTDLNPLSVHSLSALVAVGKYDVLVGVDGGQGGLAVYRQIARRHGLRGLLRRLWRKARAALAVRLRAWGLRKGGARSLRELIVAHQLASIDCAPLSRPAVQQAFTDFAPDLIVVANFGQIVQPPLLALAAKGAINVHPSLLPAYRGPMPHYWVLANGETSTGITVHYMDDGVDSGAIRAQAAFDVRSTDSEQDLQRRAVALAPDLLRTAVAAVLDGSAVATPQDEARASYYGFPPAGHSRL